MELFVENDIIRPYSTLAGIELGPVDQWTKFPKSGNIHRMGQGHGTYVSRSGRLHTSVLGILSLYLLDGGHRMTSPKLVPSSPD